MTATGRADLEQALADMNDALNREGDLRPDEPFAHAVDEILRHAVALVPAPVWLSLTVRSSPQQKPRTLASTADEAAVVDRVQYLVASGPCLDVLDVRDGQDTAPPVVATDDVSRDPRWPQLGAALRELGAPVGAVISRRLQVPTGQLSLNAYLVAGVGPSGGTGDAGAPFGTGAAAATVGLALSALQHRRRADNLAGALQSNRQIGAAMGILMARHRWTYEQAFDRMRSVSQNSNRKLRDVADEVVLTGTLPRSETTPDPG